MRYELVKDLRSALNLLDGREIRAAAGMTDLFLQDLPGGVVDLSNVEECRGIFEDEGYITVGASVTHTEAACSHTLQSKGLALALASSMIGSPQIRNIGTVGGNVINAAPAADAAVALVALEAKGLIVDKEWNYREVAVQDLYSAYNRSTLNSCDEILVKFIFKACGHDEGSSFVRLAARKALALPLANAAARVTVYEGSIVKAVLAVAPVNPAPTRIDVVEKMLAGAPVNENTWAEAERLVSQEVAVRGSLLRCSEQYRRHLIGVLAGKALRDAVEKAMKRKRVAFNE